jgi:hypothetical protein
LVKGGDICTATGASVPEQRSQGNLVNVGDGDFNLDASQKINLIRNDAL